MRVLLIVFFAGVLTRVNGRQCIKAEGKKKCTKGGNECDVSGGETCMEIGRGSSGTIKSLCGEPLAGGCWCDPTLTSQEACQEGHSCLENNKGQFKCTEDETCSMCASSDSAWKMVYHHDKNGVEIDGSVDTLIDNIRNGDEVKVWAPTFGLANIQKVSIDYNEDIAKECVNGQALFWAQNSPFLSNIYFVFSSSGNVHATQFFVNDPENKVRVNSNSATEMKWYNRNSTRLVTDENILLRAMADSAHVRASVDDSYRHIEVIDLSNGFTGVSIWELKDIMGGMEFNTTEQFLLSKWSLDGELQIGSWLVNQHTLLESQVLEGNTFKWLVDPCWNFVYKHNGDGQALSGSLERLTAALESGKRIKLGIDNVFYEANIVRQDVNTDEIVAQVFDSINPEVALGQWKWLNVHTSGKVNTVMFDVGGDQLISDIDDNNKVITWFAEERLWTNEETSADIAEKVNAGADVRFSVQTGDEVTWYQADYAQEKIIIPILPPIILPVNHVYNDREVIFDGTQHIRRYTFVNWATSFVTSTDYPVGNPTKSSRTIVSKDVNFFTNDVLFD